MIPEPIQVLDKSGDKGGSLGRAGLATFLGTMGFLAYLWWTGSSLHFQGMAANFCAHGLLIALPLFWAAIFLGRSLEFVDSEETSLGAAGYFTALDKDWWMSLLLWPAPLLALVFILGKALDPTLISGVSTRPFSALMTMAVAFCLAAFYINLVREAAPLRASEKGLRLGLVHFAQWKEIQRVEEDKGAFSVYLGVQPALPFGSIRFREKEKERLFREFLKKNGVELVMAGPGGLAGVKLAVTAVFLLLCVLGLLLYGKTRLDARWIVALVFLAGIGATLILERVRKVKEVTQVKPEIIKPLKDLEEAVSRTLCLGCLCSRAGLESGSGESDVDGAAIGRLEKWLREQDLDRKQSPEEVRLFRLLPGQWGEEEIQEAFWRQEALGTLLWALGLHKDMPPYDRRFDPEENLALAGLFQPLDRFVSGLSPLPAAEIYRARDIAELWHWRARTTQIIQEGAEAPEGFTFPGIIRMTAEKALQEGVIGKVLDFDFPAFEKPYKDLSEEEFTTMASIARQRHFALNWLCGHSPDWDRTPTDT